MVAVYSPGACREMPVFFFRATTPFRPYWLKTAKFPVFRGFVIFTLALPLVNPCGGHFGMWRSLKEAKAYKYFKRPTGGEYLFIH